MSKNTSKTMVGAFVVGAIALLAAAVLIFGSGRFFQKTLHFVAFFDGSVKGLKVGAPVMFRGVKIGEVTDIRVYSNPDTLEIKLPVVMDLYPELIEGGTAAGKKTPAMILKALIDKGLRAQLQPQSLLTGQLFVQIDFHQDRPLKLVGTEGLGLADNLLEVPTISSFKIEDFTSTIEKLPLEEIAYGIQNSLQGIEQIINSPELLKSIKMLPTIIADIQSFLKTTNSHLATLSVTTEATLADLRSLARNVDQQVAPLGANALKTTEIAQETLGEARVLLQRINDRAAAVENELFETTTRARSALQQAEKTLASFEGVFEENSAVRFNIDNFLTELTYAARSMRSFVEMLERNPEAFLRGKRRTDLPGGE